MLNNIERDKAIAISIINGGTLRRVAQDHKLSQERCRQIVYRMCAYIRRDRGQALTARPTLEELRGSKGLAKSIKKYNYAQAKPLGVDGTSRYW